MKKYTKRGLAIVLALCLCLSALTTIAFASTGGLDRNPSDIQPMTFDYVRDHINSMVSGMTNKYVLKDSSNVDLSRDVYILDPRIVSIRVDTSDVDWNTYGVYPIRYTVCFKPAVNDSYKTLALGPNESEAHDKDAKLGGFNGDKILTNRSLAYVYTDCASKLSNNEYATMMFGAEVNIGAPSYLDDFVKQAVPVYQSNTQMYSTSNKPEIPNRYYKNLSGNYSNKSFTVKAPFSIAIGEDGYFCSRCGKRFTVAGNHSYTTYGYAYEAAEVHKCDNGKGYNWITFDGHKRDCKVGDSFSVEIFTPNV